MRRFSSPQGALSAVGAPQEGGTLLTHRLLHSRPTPSLWGDISGLYYTNILKLLGPALQNHEQLCSHQTSQNYGSLSLLTR